MGALVDPVRVDIATKILRESLLDTLSDIITDPKSIVVGADQGGTPRRARPYVHISFITLPSMRGAIKDEQETRLPILDGTVTILTADSGRTYKVRLNGLPASYVAVGGDTLTTIRDNLKAKVEALGLPVTLVDNGADAFDINPDFTGAIYSLSTPTDSTRLDLTTNVSTDNADCVTYKFGSRYMTMRLQAYAKSGRSGSGGAHQIANIAYDTIDLPDVLLRFKDYRISVKPIGSPQPLVIREPGEARLESRAFLDLDVGLSSMSVRPATPLQQVEFQFILGTSTLSFNVDLNNPP